MDRTSFEDNSVKKKMEAVPLCMLSEGMEGTVVSINAGRGLERRLREMGFNSSAKIRVLRSSFGGPILVAVNNSRFALGRGMAMKIMVQCS